MAMDLLKKLRINTEQPLWLIDAPPDCAELFADLTIKRKAGKEKPVPQLLLFVTSSAELEQYLITLAEHIGPDTLFWICYPKKTSGIASDLVHMKSWDMVFQSGYRGQTSAAINEDWSGLRVTNAPRSKPSDCDIPMAERKAEGIDYVKRTVTLPADAQAAVNKVKGLSDYFYAQSFTCQKEYIMSITDAKKPETRTRRIEKMIEMLAPKMHAKQLKKK
jgi:Bacteriocin-protection, YdeI or OmpD-Associated